MPFISFSYRKIYSTHRNYRSTPKYAECLSRKRTALEQVETKLDNGLDRAINALVGWVKVYLQSEQKKTDFKPDSDFDTVASAACEHVVQQIIPIIKQVQRCLDGDNLKGIMNEIGVRLHRVIYEHLQQFQYTTAGNVNCLFTFNCYRNCNSICFFCSVLILGAMCAICDVNEYRKCVRLLNCPQVTQLFDILHALCNLLLVKHENLQEVCGGETLVRVRMMPDSVFHTAVDCCLFNLFRITWRNQWY